jgi:hypothetical protein
MTPKEKAKELVEKFSNAALLDGYESQQCALIAVDYIIKCTHSDKRANSILDKEYWQRVKTEIEKL